MKEPVTLYKVDRAGIVQSMTAIKTACIYRLPCASELFGYGKTLKHHEAHESAAAAVAAALAASEAAIAGLTASIALHSARITTIKNQNA